MAQKKKSGPPGQELVDSMFRPASKCMTAIPRVRTGIFSLDRGLGGGLPIGRISMVYGHEGSGKTTMLLRSVAEAQRTCAACWGRIDSDECQCETPTPVTVAWVDAEGVFSPEWAEFHGVDLDRLLLARPEYGEQASDAVTALSRSGAVDVIVLDSVAAVVPLAESDGSAVGENVGIHARMWNKAMRVWVQHMNFRSQGGELPPGVWLINQIRMKIGVMYGNPETTPGGMGLRFATSVSIRTEGGKSKSSVAVEEDEPVSVKLGFRITKNKVGKVGVSGEYKLAIDDHGRYVVGDVIQDNEVFAWLVSVELIEKEGRGWLFAGRKFGSKANLFDWWHDPEVWPVVYDAMIKHALGKSVDWASVVSIGDDSDGKKQ